MASPVDVKGPSPDRGGPAAPGGSAGVDVMALVMEAIYGGGPLDLAELDAAGNLAFERQQLAALEDALRERGATLDPDEREVFARGEREEVAALLRRLRVRAERARSETGAPAPRDELTQSRFRAPVAARVERLPVEDLITLGEVLHQVYEAPPAPGRSIDLSRWTPEQFRALAVELDSRGEALTAAERAALAEADAPAVSDRLARVVGRRADADRAFTAPRLRARARELGRLRPREPLRDPRQLEALRKKLLALVSETRAAPAAGAHPGTPRPQGLGAEDPLRILGLSQARFGFRGNLPPQGHSGQADSLPILQVLPPSSAEVASALGARTLVDLLARLIRPEPRAALAHALGMSSPAALLAAHRAELLDLPVRGHKAKSPHTKDVVLLGRLGAGTVGALGRLGRVFEHSPARLDLLAGLIERLQRGVPDWIGRERITRHELKEWTVAAQKRGSDIEVPAVGERGSLSEVELCAERVLAWYLGLRWADPDEGFHEMVLRLLALLRLHGVALDDGLWQRIEAECAAAEAEEYRALWEHQVEADDLERLRAERARYEEYLLEVRETSLLTDLEPLLGPDAARQDRLICFWMEPVADARHLAQAGPGLPASVQSVYVCMDPDSGAIVPFGG